MANHLSVANLQAIAALHRSGDSNRHIARVLEINLETVGKDVAELKRQTAENQPNPQTGFCEESWVSDKSASAPLAGPASSCEPHREQILRWLDAGLSIKRIHQDLIGEHDFSGPARPKIF